MRLLLLLLTSFLFLAAACTKADDDSPINPVDQLPPATQGGLNTFGCLVNEVPFINDPNRFGDVNLESSYSSINDRISIVARMDVNTTEVSRQSIRLLIRPYTVGSADTDSISFTLITYPNTGSRIEELPTGLNNSLSVTYFSFSERIISGQFNYNIISADKLDTIKITNGRFDVTFN